MIRSSAANLAKIAMITDKGALQKTTRLSQ